MQLALSTAAAPDLTLAELFDACERRGLTALELVAGGRHGVGPELDHQEVLAVAAAAAERGIVISAYRSRGLWEASAPETVRLAFGLSAPVIVTLNPVEDDVVSTLTAARRYATVGVRFLLEHGSEVEEVAALRQIGARVAGGTVGLAWDLDPATADLDRTGAAVIAATGALLQHIRLRGGGPESEEHTGQGIGALLGRLTLAHYSGALAITPSTPRYHYAWGAWLGRGRGGWGCGSKQADDSLVTLQATPSLAGNES